MIVLKKWELFVPLIDILTYKKIIGKRNFCRLSENISVYDVI